MLDLVNLMWPDCPAQSATMGSAWRSARPGLFVHGKAWRLVHRGAASSGGRRISLKEIDAPVSRRLGRGRVRGNSQPTVFRRENCKSGFGASENLRRRAGRTLPGVSRLATRLGLFRKSPEPSTAGFGSIQMPRDPIGSSCRNRRSGCNWFRCNPERDY